MMFRIWIRKSSEFVETVQKENVSTTDAARKISADQIKLDTVCHGGKHLAKAGQKRTLNIIGKFLRTPKL